MSQASANELLPEILISKLQTRYGLTYHLNYLRQAEIMIGLNDLDVLEVGGSLPKELVIDTLGARRWTSIEETEYWDELPENEAGEVTGMRPNKSEIKPLSAIHAEADIETPWSILNGTVEDLPPCMENRYDRIFSIACFEHVQRLGTALRAMFRALRPGGKLFTMHSPIWSAHDGHHLPMMQDAQGNTLNGKGGQNVEIPAWGHLMAPPHEMEAFLRQKYDPDTAERIAYYMFRSNHINRFKTEDYLRYFDESPFEREDVRLTFEVKVPEPVQTLLEKRHPGYKHFANNGILAILKKPE